MDDLQLHNDEAEESIETSSSAGKKIILALLLLAVLAGSAYYFLLLPDKQAQNITSNTTQRQPTIPDRPVVPATETAPPVKTEEASPLSPIIPETPTVPESPVVSEEAPTSPGLTPPTTSETSPKETSKTETLASSIKPEDNLQVIAASEADKPTESAPAVPPPPLFTEKKDALTNELLNTPTMPTTSMTQSSGNDFTAGGEVRQSINNNELGLGEFLKKQDSVVSIFFIDSFAKWLVDSYQPAKAGGIGKTSANVQTANLRYGTDLTGLNFIDTTIQAARKSILKYVYSPGMLDALYKLYGNRFFDAMAFASQERQPSLSPAQVEDMYKIYASYLDGIGTILQALANTKNLTELTERYHKANAAVVSSNNNFSKILRDYEQDNISPELKAKLKADLDIATKNYEVAMQNRDKSKSSLIAEIKNKSNTKLNDETVLFLSLWVSRRIPDNPNAFAATQKASEICFDLSKRLQG